MSLDCGWTCKLTTQKGSELNLGPTCWATSRICFQILFWFEVSSALDFTSWGTIFISKPPRSIKWDVTVDETQKILNDNNTYTYNVLINIGIVMIIIIVTIIIPITTMHA